MLRHSGILKKKELLLLPIVPFFRWNAFVRAAATSRKSFADTWKQSLSRSWYLCSFVCKSIIVLESHTPLSLSLSLSCFICEGRKILCKRVKCVRFCHCVCNLVRVCVMCKEKERESVSVSVCVCQIYTWGMYFTAILIFLDSFLLNQNLQRWATMAGRPRSANL